LCARAILETSSSFQPVIKIVSFIGRETWRQNSFSNRFCSLNFEIIADFNSAIIVAMELVQIIAAGRK
jgi:hypothetical protein